MIKYLGSKRRLVPVLGELASRSGAITAADLFTGTTRVAQEFKARGMAVTASDTARYSQVFAKCYIETDGANVDRRALQDALAYLSSLRPQPGYFTRTFCEQARFFTPENGARVDAIREAIEDEFAGSWMYPILLTSLIEAADRVDSTTGLQMAYLKSWAPRALQPLTLRIPELIPGAGGAILGDALEVAERLGPLDLVYLDPPYNQHSYFANYHIWETLVAWDAPEPYGVAQKRVDVRDGSNKSRFNRKREMPAALASLIRSVRARVLIVSYNDESWMSAEEIAHAAADFAESVRVLDFDSKRYVGAQIGIYNPQGQKVGRVERLRNLEHLIVAGPTDTVFDMTEWISHRGNQPAMFAT